MKDVALADLADADFFGTWRTMCAAMPSGVVDEDDDLLLAASGVGAAYFNGAFVKQPTIAPLDVVQRAIASFRRRQLPFTLRIREGVDDAVGAAAADLGLTAGERMPAMTLRPLPPVPGPRPPGPPEDVDIRRVSDQATLEDHRAVTAAGFGIPADASRLFLASELLAVEGFRLYVGYMGGRAVCSSALNVTGQTAGIYNVATVDDLRRRGLGEAMTLHALGEGAAAGCTTGSLQASTMGASLYQRMGFRTVAWYLSFTWE